MYISLIYVCFLSFYHIFFSFFPLFLAIGGGGGVAISIMSFALVPVGCYVEIAIGSRLSYFTPTFLLLVNWQQRKAFKML